MAPSGSLKSESSQMWTDFIGTQINDPEEGKDRANWINFKRVIWHESFYKLLETIEQISSSGCSIICGDGVERNICPLIMILAADYEEQ